MESEIDKHIKNTTKWHPDKIEFSAKFRYCTMQELTENEEMNIKTDMEA